MKGILKSRLHEVESIISYGNNSRQKNKMINVNKKTFQDIVKKVGPEKMKAAGVDISCASADDSQAPPLQPPKKEAVKVRVNRKEGVLEETTAKIEQLHNSIVGMLSKSLEKAIEIGGLLLEQKEIVKQDGGKYTRWAYKHLPFNIRTAQRYMKLYDYKEALREGNVKTITEAYAHIFKEPTSDEVIDIDDSLNMTDITVEASVNLDEPTLPKKKACGMMRNLVLNQSVIDNLRSGYGYRDCQGMYVKFIVELKRGNLHNKLIGDFVCAAEKYLKPGGKIIFHKK